MASTPTPEYLAEDQSSVVIAVMCVVTAVPLIAIFLRIYSRCILAPGRFGWDDGIAIIAQLFLTGYAGVTIAAALQGLGRHIEAVALENPQNLINVGLLAQVCQVLAVMSCTLGKTAFAVTLLRILTKRWVIILVWFIIITMNLVNFLTCFFVFLQCKDPRHLWNPAIPSECWDASVFTNFSLFVGAYSGLQDFVFAFIPWIVLMKLQMRKREKFGIAIAMSLGVFAGAAAIVKTTYLVALSKRSDFTWFLSPLFMWAAAEDGLAIVAGTIPTLRPLLTKLFPGISTVNSNPTPQSYPLKARTFRPGLFVPKSQSQADTRVHRGEHDDKSDRSILGNSEPEWANSNIRKTTEVTIASYENGEGRY